LKRARIVEQAPSDASPAWTNVLVSADGPSEPGVPLLHTRTRALAENGARIRSASAKQLNF
jgi:hypothetical protein